MRVKDSVVVITGASSGIGRATALAMAGRGANVVLAARREDDLSTLARECEEAGGQAIAVPTDVTDPDAVDQLGRSAVERFGRLDVWVNNAAVTLFGPFLETPLDDFRKVLDTNVMGYVYGAKAALTHMREREKGVVINVSSVVSAAPQPYTHAYSMSKAAIRSLSVSLRQELTLDGMSGIKVCTVLPATIDTPLFKQTANYTGREVVPMPPVYTPERVAHAIVNLVRMPRRETVVGPIGRGVMQQVKMSPGTTERIMAMQVDRAHLAQDKPAPATRGNLYEPSAEPGSVDGGWGGRRRTAVRRVITAATAAGAAFALVRFRPDRRARKGIRRGTFKTVRRGGPVLSRRRLRAMLPG